MYEYDTFSYRDSGLSLEYLEKSIKETPEMVIDGLLDIIECLMEACNDYSDQLEEVFCMSEFECCLCGKKFIGWGNNPWPVVVEEGARCCDECNGKFVIPARLDLMVIREEVKK